MVEQFQSLTDGKCHGLEDTLCHIRAVVSWERPKKLPRTLLSMIGNRSTCHIGQEEQSVTSGFRFLKKL